MELSEEQKIQESRYEFPYHYIPSYENGNFSQVKNLAWGYEYLSYMYFILEELEQIDFISLLDVGCGDGRFLFEAKKKFTERNLTGIDYSNRAISFAKVMNPNVNYVYGDIRDKCIFKEKFDIITLIETLEHIPPEEVESFIEGISYYLKDGGKLIITVPSNNLPVQTKHYQHFDLRSLKNMLNPKFEIIYHYFLNKIALQSKIQKMLSNNLFVLNHQKSINMVYRYYIKKCLRAKESNSKRIYILCKKTV